MSEQKNINIDMNLFKLTNNKTRKKKSIENKAEGIKIKQPSQKKKNDSLKKKSILKMIRQHQEERYNTLFDKKIPNEKVQDNNNFNKEFDEAKKFMQNLTDKTNNTTNFKNKSLKNYSSSTNSLLYTPSLDHFSNSNSNPIKEVSNSIIKGTIQPSQIILNPNFPNNMNSLPKYGCLKNGQLPTYRDYLNKTRKINDSTTNLSGGNNNINSTVNNNIQFSKPPSENRNEIMEKKINDSISRINEMKQVEIKLQQIKDNTKPRKMKQKKTVRRTYKVGKSKMLPKVSVLVSNKTIRNNISDKTQFLKQTPIEEVKKHLIKCGLIKVGTVAPNDVLRKMYESSNLICGELYNHNPDNLLYNFINGPKN